MNFRDCKSVYFLGIGGIGMSAIADAEVAVATGDALVELLLGQEAD